MSFRRVAYQVGQQFCCDFCQNYKSLLLYVKFVPVHKKMQKCPTCLEPLTSGSTNHAVSTPCGHLFHVNCVQGWIARGNKTCPQCRSDISKGKLLRIYLQPTESDTQIPLETEQNYEKASRNLGYSVAYSHETNYIAINSTLNPSGTDNELSNPRTTAGQYVHGQAGQRGVSSTPDRFCPKSCEIKCLNCQLILIVIFCVGSICIAVWSNAGKEHVSFINYD